MNSSVSNFSSSLRQFFTKTDFYIVEICFYRRLEEIKYISITTTTTIKQIHTSPLITLLLFLSMY